MVDSDGVKLCLWVESVLKGPNNSRKKFTVQHHKEALARWPILQKPSDELPPVDEATVGPMDQALENKLVKAINFEAPIQL